jgi:hypothetical protein
MISKIELFTKSELYKYIIILISIIATLLIAMETAEVDDATYNIIINTEIVVFGLLAVDFLFRLLFFSIQKKPFHTSFHLKELLMYLPVFQLFSF